MCRVKMFSVILLLLVCIGFNDCAAEQCPSNELQCDDGTCILKREWCDGNVDCWDNSDESYCNGEEFCSEDLHFPCRNGRCIPLLSVCDRYNDCHDGSDEEDCELKVVSIPTDDVPLDILPEMNSSRIPSVGDAVSKAVKFLLAQRNADGNWDSFTPRAIIALSFASKVSTMAEKEKQIMKKQLDINLLFDLMENRLSTSSLALYINALYATCQDPRNYRGIDLVGRLKWDTIRSLESNSSLPISFLALCIADEMIPNELKELANMYYRREFARTPSKALIAMTMICHSLKQRRNIFEEYLTDFFSKEMRVSSEADAYTAALLMQAKIASGSNIDSGLLTRQQLKDGSFGGILSTYAAIPALLNLSFLDMRCNTTNKGEQHGNLMAKVEGRNHAIISVWTNAGKEATSYSRTVSFDGEKSLYDVMLMASETDPSFRFSFDETPEGKTIYSINGIPNDIESGKTWNLYSGTIGSVNVNSMKNLRLISDGIDMIDASQNTHFVFWQKRMQL